MRKRVNKPRVKRAPVKREAQGARFPRRDQTNTGGNPALPLEKLLHDTYARRACHLL
jgi:hypothetical protein